MRRAYAKQVLAAINVRDPRIEQAFATIRREDFLAPERWQIFRMPGSYVPTPDADPVYLYTDCLVAIAPDKSINNGQPTPWKPEIRALSPA